MRHVNCDVCPARKLVMPLCCRFASYAIIACSNTDPDSGRYLVVADSGAAVGGAGIRGSCILGRAVAGDTVTGERGEVAP